MAALPGLQIGCFGPPTATVGGRAPAPDVLWTKHLALLVYLALSPGHRRSREHLMGLLWGESPQESARESLNNALFLLRKRLGKHRLPTEGASVVLNDEGLEVDALRVIATEEQAPAEADSLMRGVFLEGFYVDNAPQFEDWMSEERRRYEDLRPRVRVAAGRRALTEGRFAVAAEYARCALDQAPHAEPAIELRMRALARLGDAAAALAAFHEWAARLEHDVAEQPSKALQALADRIRGQLPLRRPEPAQPPLEAPLVGRVDVHRQVFRAVDDALAAGPRTILITGAPGMGRTRLLSECVSHGGLEGARIGLVRPLESDHDARWSALRNLVRAGLADAPGLTGAPPDALAVLAAFVPGLAQRFAPRETGDVAEVAVALGAVLAAVAEETPLILAVDDAHWSDGPSLAALHAAVGSLERAPVLLAVTAAAGVGDPPRELQRLQAAIGRELEGVAVVLEPLSDGDVHALVAKLAARCKTETARDRLTRRLVLDTGGSPLFAVTMLGALDLAPDPDDWPPAGATEYAPLPVPLPLLVHTSVVLRIGELRPDEQTVLAAASVGGQGIDLDLVAALIERSPADVERLLPPLERRRLVVFDGARYLFGARLVREVVRQECLTRGERRRLEGLAVKLLAGRADLESRALRSELIARVDPNADALTFVLDVVAEALDSGAVRLARRVWAAASEIAAATASDRGRLEALRARL